MVIRVVGILALATYALLPGVALADTTGSTGSGQPHSNLQPSLGITYIISLQGIFPPRPPSGGSGGGIEPFLGELAMTSANFAPKGWALAHGQLLPINQNQALFSILGTTYGGNGFTTFALPDLRGRVPIGAGQGAGLTNRPLGQQTGAELVTLTTAQLPSHSHSLPGGGTTAATGSGATHSEMQPSLALNYIIARQGLFPPRPDGGSGGGLDPYLGEIMLFAGNFAPTGWSFADGQILNIAENTALFSLLGTTYGGNGTTTFALPDLRGRATLAPGQGPGLSNRTLGQNVGAEATAITTARMPSHSHTLASGSTGLTGSGTAHSNMQPSLGINYIIAMEGIFPSQFGAGGEGDPDGGSGGSGRPYVGEIQLFAGNFAPVGWKFADGSVLSIAQYETLFQLIGTTYGGDGQNTFALPDFRGRIGIGTGQGTGLSNQLLGQTHGAENVALTTSEMPSHTHTYSASLPGDFNADGKVDAADYVAWRKGLVAQTTPNYNLWRTNFGRTLPGSGGHSPVPEPATLALALLTATAASACQRRRSSSARV